MRVNVYAEEMTDRLELVKKTINGRTYTGLRFYLELPVTLPYDDGRHFHPPMRGPFMHLGEDDDSAAVTFWGKQDLRKVLRAALELLDRHYAERDAHG